MLGNVGTTNRVTGRRARAKRLAMVLAALAVVIGVGVLLGWVLDVPALTHWGSAPASTKPLTGVGILAAGGTIIATLLSGRAGLARRAGLAGAVGAAAATAVGVGVIAMKALGLGVAPGSEVSGLSVLLLQPSWATGAGLFFCGVGVAMLQIPRRWAVWGRWGAALSAGGIASIGAMGFALGVVELYASPLFNTIAYPTVVTLGLLSVAMSLAQPEYGVVAVTLRDDAGGTMARVVLPVVVVVPLLACLLAQLSTDAGVMGSRMALGAVGVFVAGVGSVAVGVTARRLGMADVAQRHSDRRVRLLLSELEHRVRNTMATVLSISDQTAARSDTLDQFRMTFQGRLRAMTRAHDALSAQRWQSVSLRQIVETVVGAYAVVDGGTLRVEGDDVLLPNSAALSLAITLNELATNAVKHGAWAVASSLGQVRVAWRLSPEQALELEWQESGGPAPAPVSRRSFGFDLITGLIPHDMGGEVQLVVEPPGVRCFIRAPIAPSEETPRWPAAALKRSGAA